MEQRKMRIFTVITVCVLITGSGLSAASGGRVGFSFLKVSADARAAALGESYTAVADDAASLFWNPAGLAFAQNNSVHLMHNSWLSGVNHEFGAIQLFHGRHNIGVSLNLAHVPGIQLRGPSASEQPDGETSATNMALGLGYALRTGDRLGLGIQLKYMYEEYYLVSAGGFAVDLGVTYREVLPALTLAASLQNLGSMGALEQESTPLPALLRIGADYRLPLTLLGRSPRLVSDLLQVFDDVTRWGIGLEGDIGDHLRIRVGYVTGSEAYDLTAGMGVRFSVFELAYAFVPVSYDLGDSHRISLNIDF